jgi:3-carboxy-cis,cis-muconate cycloisomerase
MTIGPFDHPLLGSLLADPEATRHFTVASELAAMLAFEAALAAVEADCGLVPAPAAEAIGEAARTLVPDLERLRAAVLADGLCVPELVRQLRARVGAPHAQWVHLGATSQDVIDTALMLRLRPALGVIGGRLAALDGQLAALRERHGGRPLMGRTRMQPALPITLGQRLESWRQPLVDLAGQRAGLEPRLLRLQLGGAVGDRAALGAAAEAVAAALARRLDLGPADPVWHTARAPIGELASWLSLVSASLGKIGQDVVLMVQSEVGEARLTSGGGSSAMPHKVNPVKAETLVSLARFNAVLLGGVHQAMVHEQERSGIAWTLEWMTLPQMLLATAGGLRLADLLLGELDFDTPADRA